MRKPIIVASALVATLTLAGMVVLAQQDKGSRPSPPAKAGCKLRGGKTISVDYSSPRAKGRKIFGGLVPYGQVWRAGANEATTFVTTGDISVGGKTVPAGKYTIFAIPAEDKWTLVISKKTCESGTAYPGPDTHLATTHSTLTTHSHPSQSITFPFTLPFTPCTTTP